MSGENKGVVGQIEKLVGLVFNEIADALDMQADYAREDRGCPAKYEALRSAADGVRNIYVPEIMARLMEAPSEDKPQAD